MRRLRVLSDFDNTIVDILPEWCFELRCAGFADCRPEHIKVYSMATNPCLAGVTETVLMDTLRGVHYVWEHNEMPTHVTTPWIAGVTEHLPKLVAEHDFTFVSCQPVDAKRQTANKQRRLRFIVPNAVVNYHADAKQRLDMDADVFIDDRADSVWEWCRKHPAGLGLLMAAPYNTEAKLPSNGQRVTNWAEVAESIADLASVSDKPVLLSPAEMAVPAPPMLDLYPEDAAARKQIPLYSGGIKYFPDAWRYVGEDLENAAARPFDHILADYARTNNHNYLVEAWHCLVDLHTEGEDGLKRDAARVSYLGNQQHNPGQPLHWARGKSMDQLDAAARHEAEYRAGKRFDKAG